MSYYNDRNTIFKFIFSKLPLFNVKDSPGRWMTNFSFDFPQYYSCDISRYSEQTTFPHRHLSKSCCTYNISISEAENQTVSKFLIVQSIL